MNIRTETSQLKLRTCLSRANFVGLACGAFLLAGACGIFWALRGADGIDSGAVAGLSTLATVVLVDAGSRGFSAAGARGTGVAAFGATIGTCYVLRMHLQ